MKQYKSFHLYLLIGQSNMAGRGEVESQDKEIHPRVFTLDKESKWMPGFDPIHFDKPIAGVGPGLTFGKIMAKYAQTARIGLIPCAAGGSSISVWKPGGYWEQTDSHPYDDAVERTKIAMENGVLKGILWHQGASDSNENDAELYEERLVTLINSLRSDLRTPNLFFIVATLGDFFVERCPEAKIVNEALRRISQQVENTACVDSAGLDHKGDQLHFSAESSRELGWRYAEALIRLQNEVKTTTNFERNETT